MQQTLTEMQLLENTSEQVKAMGQEEASDVAKINKRKKTRTNRKFHKMNRSSKTNTVDIVMGHIRDKRNFALHKGNFVVNVANLIIFRQSVCQLRMVQEINREETEHENHDVKTTIND